MTLPASFWNDTYRVARLAVRQDEAPARRSFGQVFNLRWRVATAVGICAAAIAIVAAPQQLTSGAIIPPAPVAQNLDVNTLVGSHAGVAIDEPLADHSRLTMIVSDTAAQQVGGDSDDSAVDAVSGVGSALPATD